MSIQTFGDYLRDLFNGTFDMTSPTTTMFSDRIDYLDFSYPSFVSQSTMVLTQRVKPQHNFTYLTPFKPIVWVVYSLVCIAVWLIIWAENLNPRNFNKLSFRDAGYYQVNLTHAELPSGFLRFSLRLKLFGIFITSMLRFHLLFYSAFWIDQLTDPTAKYIFSDLESLTRAYVDGRISQIDMYGQNSIWQTFGYKVDIKVQEYTDKYNRLVRMKSWAHLEQLFSQNKQPYFFFTSHLFGSFMYQHFDEKIASKVVYFKDLNFDTWQGFAFRKNSPLKYVFIIKVCFVASVDLHLIS